MSLVEFKCSVKLVSLGHSQAIMNVFSLAPCRWRGLLQFSWPVSQLRLKFDVSEQFHLNFSETKKSGMTLPQCQSKFSNKTQTTKELYMHYIMPNKLTQMIATKHGLKPNQFATQSTGPEGKTEMELLLGGSRNGLLLRALIINIVPVKSRYADEAEPPTSPGQQARHAYLRLWLFVSRIRGAFYLENKQANLNEVYWISYTLLRNILCQKPWWNEGCKEFINLLGNDTS